MAAFVLVGLLGNASAQIELGDVKGLLETAWMNARGGGVIAAVAVPPDLQDKIGARLALEKLQSLKAHMMELSISEPHEVRGKNEKAYGVITHWSWENYKDKQEDILGRRADLVIAIRDYAKAYGADDGFLELLHWTRVNKLAIWNDVDGEKSKREGRRWTAFLGGDRTDSSIFPFVKDDEFASLPGQVRAAYDAKYPR
ncbi:MAG: hypothetical protein NTX64_10225 [Elusimicrobia bacterium]|nr:hypothetical protein [Elusimicrobiota bacterium]